MTSEVDAAIAMLRPWAMLHFFRISLALSRNRSRLAKHSEIRAGVASVDPPSTIMISSGDFVCAATDLSHRSIDFASLKTVAMRAAFIVRSTIGGLVGTFDYSFSS